MKKKLLALLACSFLSVLMISGCGTNNQDPPPEDDVNVEDPANDGTVGDDNGMGTDNNDVNTDNDGDMMEDNNDPGEDAVEDRNDMTDENNNDK